MLTTWEYAPHYYTVIRVVDTLTQLAYLWAVKRACMHINGTMIREDFECVYLAAYQSVRANNIYRNGTLGIRVGNSSKAIVELINASLFLLMMAFNVLASLYSMYVVTPIQRRTIAAIVCVIICFMFIAYFHTDRIVTTCAQQEPIKEEAQKAEKAIMDTWDTPHRSVKSVEPYRIKYMNAVAAIEWNNQLSDAYVRLLMGALCSIATLEPNCALIAMNLFPISTCLSSGMSYHLSYTRHKHTLGALYESIDMLKANTALTNDDRYTGNIELTTKTVRDIDESAINYMMNEPLTLLANVNFKITGNNGSGKTTLARTIAGCIRDTNVITRNSDGCVPDVVYFGVTNEWPKLFNLEWFFNMSGPFFKQACDICQVNTQNLDGWVDNASTGDMKAWMNVPAMEVALAKAAKNGITPRLILDEATLGFTPERAHKFLVVVEDYFPGLIIIDNSDIPLPFKHSHVCISTDREVTMAL
jgi:predicted ATPase